MFSSHIYPDEAVITEALEEKAAIEEAVRENEKNKEAIVPEGERSNKKSPRCHFLVLIALFLP
jgi:hypothetical protein